MKDEEISEILLESGPEVKVVWQPAGKRQEEQVMAVEAQLCPQCGAAVQFGAGQTEVVCAHCGTTVLKGAAAGAASVEKEIADEKLIQETVGRERKLRGRGRPATGKIVSAQATG